MWRMQNEKHRRRRFFSIRTWCYGKTAFIGDLYGGLVVAVADLAKLLAEKLKFDRNEVGTSLLWSEREHYLDGAEMEAQCREKLDALFVQLVKDAEELIYVLEAPFYRSNHATARFIKKTLNELSEAVKEEL